MERTGLKRLMADIEARKVDTVVVYKVDRLTRKLRGQLLETKCTELYVMDAASDLNQQPFTLTIETKLKRYGGEMRLVIPEHSSDRTPANEVPSLIKAISRAHEWVRLIVAGEYKNQMAIAHATGLNRRYICKIIPAAFLSPEIVEAIVKGRQAPEMTLLTLLNKIPLSWIEQKRKLHWAVKDTFRTNQWSEHLSVTDPRWYPIQNAGE
jgi:Resolvase, N terminal domain